MSSKRGVFIQLSKLVLGSAIYRVESGEESEMSRDECPMAHLSGRVLQLACALIPSCSDPTSNGQVSVLKCHPWIDIADTHSTRGIITKFNHTLITSTVSKRELITKIWLKAI